jgi:hypothetical protein
MAQLRVRVAAEHENEAAAGGTDDAVGAVGPSAPQNARPPQQPPRRHRGVGHRQGAPAMAIACMRVASGWSALRAAEKEAVAAGACCESSCRVALCCVMLHVACRVLSVACRLLNVACRMLHVACGVLHAACCTLHVACRVLHVACCLSHVACCTSCVACCMPHVACRVPSAVVQALRANRSLTAVYVGGNQAAFAQEALAGIRGI